MNVSSLARRLPASMLGTIRMFADPRRATRRALPQVDGVVHGGGHRRSPPLIWSRSGHLGEDGGVQGRAHGRIDRLDRRQDADPRPCNDERRKMARLDDLPDGRAPRFDARVSFPDEIAVHVLDLGVESYDLHLTLPAADGRKLDLVADVERGVQSEDSVREKVSPDREGLFRARRRRASRPASRARPASVFSGEPLAEGSISRLTLPDARTG